MNQTRWLNDEEQRAWRAFLAANKLLLAQVDRQMQQEAGIPHTYYEVLVRLSEAPDHTLRMSQLAASCQCSPSRLSHAVSRLEVAGWVRRAECPDDKRGAFCTLTPAGLATLDTAIPRHVEVLRAHLFDQLTPEQITHFRAICEAIVSGSSPIPMARPERPRPAARRPPATVTSTEAASISRVS